MKKIYEKNELTFAIVWIVVYCILQSLANPLGKVIGIGHIINLFNGSGMDLVSNLFHLGSLIAVAVAYTLILTRTLPNRQLAMLQGESTDEIKER